MTDKRKGKQSKGWKSAQKTSHNIDLRIVEIVRFLARRSAEQDFERYLKCSASMLQKSDVES